MKKLVLLLSVLLILSSIAPSPVLAARPSLEYRLQSILAILYQSIFPYSGIYNMPGEVIPIGGDPGTILGGDADDYGNGKSGPSNTVTPKGLKDVLPGPGQGTLDKGTTNKLAK
ncbi:MAG: hypothetical protein ABR899_03755 [Candidatus Krumholzibacteriaceae bacterium]|jgi:hypothetical protein